MLKLESTTAGISALLRQAIAANPTYLHSTHITLAPLNRTTFELITSVLHSFDYPAATTRFS